MERSELLVLSLAIHGQQKHLVPEASAQFLRFTTAKEKEEGGRMEERGFFVLLVI